MNTGIIDKVLRQVAPGWAADRAIARQDLKNIQSASGVWDPWGHGRGGYAGGAGSRMRKSQAGWRSTTQTEDAVAGSTLDNVRLEAMDLYRNNPLCKSGVNGIVEYLGHSIPRASTSGTVGDAGSEAESLAFNDEATDYFNSYWWRRADARRRGDYGDMQDMASRSRWLWGDMPFIITDDGLLPVEGMQIATPTALNKDRAITSGVRMKAGRMTHIYVCGFNDHGSIDRKDFKRIRMDSVIWCGDPWRAAQVRTQPQLHGVVDMMRDHEETHENTINKIKFEAMMLTKERTGLYKNTPGRRTVTDSSTGIKTEFEETAWGMRFRTNGDPDDLQVIDGPSPNAQYVATMEYQGRLIAAGMGIPYEMMMHIFTNGSYTANRAARADFLHLLNREWDWRNRKLNQRVWNYVIARAIERKRIRPAPVDARGFSQWWKAEWSLPHMHEIDQGKEEAARSKKWGNATSSLNDFARQRGMTRGEMLDAHDDDIREMQQRAESLGVAYDQYAPGLGIKAPATPEPSTVKE